MSASSILWALRRLSGSLSTATSSQQLLERLEDGLVELGGDCPVRLLHQEARAESGVPHTLVPVLRQGLHPIATIALGDREQEPSEELVVAAGLAAHQAAALLGQLELQEAAVGRGLQLSILNDVTRAMNSEDEAAGVLARATEGFAALLGCESLGLYGLTDGELCLAETGGEGAGLPSTITVTSRDGRLLLGLGGATVRLGPGSVLGTPALVQVLRHGVTTEGVLVLRAATGRTSWEEDDLALAEALTENLRIARANVALLEASRREAAYDSLTGLVSRRQFFIELARETERVRRQGSPLSLLMLDADHFKSINDTYGHAGGDAVLCALARCLRHGTRSLDTVGRLGGEELGVLLPGADEATAIAVAERLRGAIEAMRVPYRGEAIQVTVSIGLTEWDLEQTLEDLMATTDKALYQSKREGRNRVTARRELESLELVAPEPG